MVSVASNPDILIIGAGLAGAAAAEALAARGFTATVLEARDRVGGRGFSRPFADSDELLEFGGAWIRPWQVHIHEACARHGVALRPRAPVTERRWFRDGALHKDGPASPEDLAQHERCVARIAADALSLKKGEERNELGQSLTDISFTAYLTRIGAPAGDARSVRRLVDGQRQWRSGAGSRDGIPVELRPWRRRARQYDRRVCRYASRRRDAARGAHDRWIGRKLGEEGSGHEDRAWFRRRHG